MFRKLLALMATVIMPAPVLAEDFSGLHLRRFVSPGFGIVLNAPESWNENSDAQFFQVIDPATNAQFTSSGFAVGEDMTLQRFASARLSIVDRKTPYLKQVRAAYTLRGKTWEGTASEYQGAFPGNTFESHYLVLCILFNKTAISFTITAPVDAFKKNEALYRWLLINQLDIYKVVRVDG